MASGRVSVDELVEKFRNDIDTQTSFTMQVECNSQQKVDQLFTLLEDLALRANHQCARVSLTRETQRFPADLRYYLEVAVGDWLRAAEANSKITAILDQTGLPTTFLVDALDFPDNQRLIDIKERVRSLTSTSADKRLLWIVFALDHYTVELSRTVASAPHYDFVLQ